jgi:hypothetical protein
MEKIILIISIICFLNSFWWIIAKVAGPLFFKLCVKLLGILGTSLPIIYWTDLLKIGL